MIEQQLVRHAAPEEIGHPRGQRVGVDAAQVAGGIRRLGQKEESRGDQHGAQGEQNGGLEFLALLARGAKEREILRDIVLRHRTAECARQEGLQDFARGLFRRDAVARLAPPGSSRGT